MEKRKEKPKQTVSKKAQHPAKIRFISHQK
jgi:hypothetical protein